MSDVSFQSVFVGKADFKMMKTNNPNILGSAMVHIFGVGIRSKTECEF